jgi:regulatory protein
MPHDGPPGSREEAGGLDGALECCYRHLARCDHSIAEMRARLGRAQLRPPVIAEALAIVAGQGYLDDERYARGLVEDRRTIDGWGVERIRARLEAAGIDGELIDEVLAGFDATTELAAAVAVLHRRCDVPLSEDRQRRRAVGILISRGFDSEIAYDAVRSCARGASSDA